MKCPYCLSDVDAEAVACKYCTKDLYLFQPLMKKVADLESQLRALASQASLEARIHELESYIETAHQERESQQGILAKLGDVAQYLILPLFVLLVAHALITVVYDFNLLYLRLISILAPLPFAYTLFAKRSRVVLPWFLGAIVLAASAVIGMSVITSLVDKTPILPQNTVEWKEFIEYSASISFSFLTGMLLGGLAYVRRHQPKGVPVNPWAAAVIAGLGEGKLSPETLQKMMHKVNEFGGTVIALCATAMSIYTGLRAVL